MAFDVEGAGGEVPEEKEYALYPQSCDWCPRRCGAARAAGGVGFCGAGSKMRLARAALHFWEEPPISGTAGSGTVFFAGCSLRCVYCQNREISFFDERAAEQHVSAQKPANQNAAAGCRAAGQKMADHSTTGCDAACNQPPKAITPAALAKIFLNLQSQGAMNINLVTPTHYLEPIKHAVKIAKQSGLHLPIVWNTSGYETPEVVRALAGTVDVFLTDYKYASDILAQKLSAAPDYAQVVHLALLEMLRVVGAPAFDEYAGHVRLTRGVVVRHLILPGHVDNSLRVLDALVRLQRAYRHECAGSANVACTGGGAKDSTGTPARADAGETPPLLLSLMSQYTPVFGGRAAQAFPELLRTVSPEEYEAVLDYADALGFEDYFWQDGAAAKESFIPAFDSTGV